MSRNTPIKARRFRGKYDTSVVVAGIVNDISAIGSLSISGIAALVATGALLTAGSLSITGAADLDAPGKLEAAGALSINGAADLDAAGELLAAGSLSITGAADLDAGGSLIAAGTLSITGAADLTAPATNDIVAAGSLSITGTADLDATGTLAAEGSLSISGAADLQSAGTPVVEAAQPSGGWPIYAYSRKRKLAELRRELEEEQEREELAERLERTLVDDGSLTQAQADLIRLRGVVAQYGRDDLTNRARRAIAFAERAQNDFSYQLAMREMRRLGEEEELAVLLLMALD